MKILFVVEHFYPYIGGAEKLFYELSTNLAKKGFDVTVVTTQYDRKLPLSETHLGVTIERVKCSNRYAFTILSIPKIIKHAKGSALIHTTTYNAAFPAVIAGKLMRKPVYVTFHEVWGDLWKRLPFTSFFERNAFYIFEKVLLKLPFDKFIAVSEFTKRKLKEAGIKENKIVRIYNGIHYASFADYKKNPPKLFTYTFFGRLGISKGLDLLIPATAKFKKKYPDTKLKLIIPKEPAGMYNQISKLIASYNLEDDIEFHHNLSREKLYEELLNSSCVVIPSYSEGFCFAAAETVAMRIPIISSHLGALKEVVSGTFVKMEEQTALALYNALEQAYLGQWNQVPVKQYYLTESIKMYEEMYAESL